MNMIQEGEIEVTDTTLSPYTMVQNEINGLAQNQLRIKADGNRFQNQELTS